MDNFQFWLYVIVAVIYLISRARKKSKEQNAPVDFPDQETTTIPRSYDQPTSPKPKPLTFEELLREITEAKESRPAPRPEPEYVDYDDEIEEEEGKSMETITPINEERTTQVYEDAKKLAFYRPSLEETMKLEDTDTKYGKFAEFEIKEERNLLLEYSQDLRDPKGFKRALILSEILNRKHF